MAELLGEESKEMSLGDRQENIQHLVISGGGIRGIFSSYGVLRKKHAEGLWSINNIKSVYGTSAGSVVAVLMILIKALDWKVLDDYLIQRPWEKFFSRDKFVGLVEAISSGGFLTKDVMVQSMAPLLLAADLSIDITLSEFFSWSNIDLHCFCVELIGFTSIDMSNDTHSDWKLIDVLWRSCSIPIILLPDREGNKVYLDGSILTHYPLDTCIAQKKCSPNSVIGVKNVPSTDFIAKDMLSMIFVFFQNIFLYLNGRFNTTPIKHEFTSSSSTNTLEETYMLLHSQEARQNLIFHAE
jgi:predicted acylesterase/phospholipase RssA